MKTFKELRKSSLYATLDEALVKVTDVEFDYRDQLPNSPKPSDLGSIADEWKQDRVALRDAVKKMGGLVTNTVAPSRGNRWVGTVTISTRGDASKLDDKSIQKAVKSHGIEIHDNQFRESTVDSAARKPENYTKPDGKTGVRMVAVKKDVIKRDNDKHTEESTKEYGKSVERIQDKKKKDAISSSDKQKLASLKKMMSKEKYRPPTPAEIAADKKKDQRGKSRPSMTHKSAKQSVYKNMMGGLKKETVEESAVLEAKRPDAAADSYFTSYSGAITSALDSAKKKGFEVDEDDVFNQVTTGQGKPSKGKTVRHTLKLTKGGKAQKKALHIQVYNRGTNGKTFELNSYIA